MLIRDSTSRKRTACCFSSTSRGVERRNLSPAWDVWRSVADVQIHKPELVDDYNSLKLRCQCSRQPGASINKRILQPNIISTFSPVTHLHLLRLSFSTYFHHRTFHLFQLHLLSSRFITSDRQFRSFHCRGHKEANVEITVETSPWIL
jgi:hypothetical protein